MDDSLTLPGFPPSTCKFGSSEEEFPDSDDIVHSRTRLPAIQNQPLVDSNMVLVPMGHIKQEFRRRQVPQGWLHKMVFFSCFNPIITCISFKYTPESDLL